MYCARLCVFIYLCMYFIYAISLYYYDVNHVLICYVCQLLKSFKISNRLKSSKELMFYVVSVYICFRL